ncbi:MAG: alpha/beta hydrolase fold domain-containing protein [Alphaproteobacteria bacterium]|nr:alpha/beta hydrolase fold domain-containing protein [Alphaproteobacteria bacterium]
MNSLRHVICAFNLVAALSACSPTGIINSLTPESGYTVDRAVPFGDDPRQRLDVYVPDAPAAGTPLVVFFYGGGWESGERQQYKFVGEAFAAQGYTVAVPDYRLYPQVRWRGFMADAADAVAFLAGRPEAGSGIVLMGHSAGAYIAAMLVLDEAWLDLRGVARCRIRAGIGLAGPYDLLPLRDSTLKQIFGPGEPAEESQPIAHVDPGAPVMLLATGGRDTTVRPRNTRDLAARLVEAGVPVELRIYDGVGHAPLVGALSRPLRSLAPTHEDVFAFLTTLPPGGRAPCS